MSIEILDISSQKKLALQSPHPAQDKPADTPSVRPWRDSNELHLLHTRHLGCRANEMPRGFPPSRGWRRAGPPSGRAEWDPLGLLPQFKELREGLSG